MLVLLILPPVRLLFYKFLFLYNKADFTALILAAKIVYNKVLCYFFIINNLIYINKLK